MYFTLYLCVFEIHISAFTDVYFTADARQRIQFLISEHILLLKKKSLFTEWIFETKEHLENACELHTVLLLRFSN